MMLFIQKLSRHGAKRVVVSPRFRLHGAKVLLITGICQIRQEVEESEAREEYHLAGCNLNVLL